jgi:hypothetical protein
MRTSGQGRNRAFRVITPSECGGKIGCTQLKGGKMRTGYKVITLAEAQPGMVLSDDLLDRLGHMLLASGTVLSAAIISSLGRHGIGVVPVQSDEHPAGDPAQVQARLDHLFRAHEREDQNDWAANILRRYVEDYRIGREVAP